MKTINLVLILCSLFLLSCIDLIMIGGGRAVDYQIYITGDSGRVLNISYLAAPPEEDAKKNITISETVTLPFFKQVPTIIWGDDDQPNSFLEIKSSHDSTTRAIIFDDDLLLADSICWVFVPFFPENAVDDCLYCKDLPKDSVLNYLKGINYPCYTEFSSRDTIKKISLYDWWYKN